MILGDRFERCLPAMPLVNRTTCANPNCDSLSFVFPETKDPVTRPQGLAGPVVMTILDGAQVLATIDSLYLPSNGCRTLPPISPETRCSKA